MNELSEIGDMHYPRVIHIADIGDPEAVEAADGFWQHDIYLFREDEDSRANIHLSFFEQDFRWQQQWWARLHRAMATTRSYNLAELLDEATPFHAARGAWPELVVCILPNDWHRGTPRETWQIDAAHLVVYMREVLLANIPFEQEIGIYAIQPFVTPFEQFGEDALNILVDAESRPDLKAILVIEDHWQGDYLQMWLLRVETIVDTWQIVEAVDRMIDCSDYDATCRLECELQELPRMVQWRTLPGMKIYLTIRKEEACQALGLFEEEEETILVQTECSAQQIETRQGRRWARLQADPVYYQLTSSLDSRMVQQPSGGVTKIWL